MDKGKLIVCAYDWVTVLFTILIPLSAEAWVGKGQYTKQIDIKGRGRYGIRTTRRARMTVVLKEGKTLEEKKANERAYKLKRIVSASHVRENKPLRNPGAMWAW
jgi:large subunit ribosomal protein L22